MDIPVVPRSLFLFEESFRSLLAAARRVLTASFVLTPSPEPSTSSSTSAMKSLRFLVEKSCVFIILLDFLSEPLNVEPSPFVGVFWGSVPHERLAPSSSWWESKTKPQSLQLVSPSEASNLVRLHPQDGHGSSSTPSFASRLLLKFTPPHRRKKTHPRPRERDFEDRVWRVINVLRNECSSASFFGIFEVIAHAVGSRIGTPVICHNGFSKSI